MLCCTIQACVGDYYLFENMAKPREMPRPLALTGTTVHTETLGLHEMTKQK